MQQVLNIQQHMHAFYAEKAPERKRMMLASVVHALLHDMIVCQIHCQLCCQTAKRHVATQQAVSLTFC